MGKILAVTGILLVLSLGSCTTSISSSPSLSTVVTVRLPQPELEGEVSVEEALYQRRSIREFGTEGLTLAQVSQLLWSGQGVTAEWGGRTAPSAGGLYPLELYLVAGDVAGLAPGVYKYEPGEHVLRKIVDGDIRGPLAQACLDQSWVKDASVDIVIAAVYERTTKKYGDRGVRYVHIEVGHAAQNICLQATALDLGAVTVGAFDDEQVKKILAMAENESPLYVLPVGRKR